MKSEINEIKRAVDIHEYTAAIARTFHTNYPLELLQRLRFTYTGLLFSLLPEETFINLRLGDEIYTREAEIINIQAMQKLESEIPYSTLQQVQEYGQNLASEVGYNWAEIEIPE